MSYKPLPNKEDTPTQPWSKAQLQPVQPLMAQPMMIAYTNTAGVQMAYPPQPMVTFTSIPMPNVQSQTITPNSHLVLTVVLFVILTIFAPESLFFMIPALVLAFMSSKAIHRGNLAQAKRLGNGALGLNFAGLIFTFVFAIICVALSISLFPWRRGYYYHDYYYGGCYYDYEYYDNYYGSGGYVDYPMICY